MAQWLRDTAALREEGAVLSSQPSGTLVSGDLMMCLSASEAPGTGGALTYTHYH